MFKNYKQRSQMSEVNDPLQNDWNLLEDYRRFRKNPAQFVASTYRLMAGAGFAAYNEYIGSKIYTGSHWQKNMLEKTLSQPIVKSCVDRVVNNELTREISLLNLSPDEQVSREQQCRDQVMQRLRNVALKALPTFSQVIAVRVEYLFFSQVLSRAYLGGMHLDRAQVTMLKKKAQELAGKKQSLVLLPCHKSHLDYIVLVYVFFTLGLSLPMTMAGENLDIPLISYFIKQVGATFMRRGNWKEDALYNTFFQGLINTILQQGFNLQIFIEGTRSRTGKLLPPKFGLLKFIYEAVASGTVEDCWIVPVSTQYDKVIEADTYATELMGREKRPENLMSFLDTRSVVKMNLGRIDIQFSEGFSLKEFIGNQLAKNSTPPQICRTLAYRVLSDINGVSVIMPSDLVGTALLTSRQRGLSSQDLIFRIKTLMRRIEERGGRFGALTKPTRQLNDDDIRILTTSAIDVLKPDLITLETHQLLEPICYAKDEFRLSYYRNRLVHLFVDEALVCTCLYQHFTQTLSLEVSLEELEAKVTFLSVLLSREFIFETSRDLPSAMRAALSRLVREKIVSKLNNNSITINSDEIRTNWGLTHFYCYFIWPYIDGYWSTLLSLQSLPCKKAFSLKSFLRIAQVVANTLYSEGALAHVEACNREIIISAIEQAESRKLISRTKTTITVEADSAMLSLVGSEISTFRNEVQKRPANDHLINKVNLLARELVSSKL